MKKKRNLFIGSGTVILTIIAVVFVLSRINNSPFVTDDESPKIYHLENAAKEDEIQRVVTVTLYSDGTAEIPQPAISSFSLTSYNYSVVDNELLLYTDNKKEYMAVFTVEDKNTLVFKSKTLPIFADIGARYIHE